MARISTTIAVQDGLSSTFQRMTQAISGTVSQFERLDRAANGNSLNNAANGQRNLNDELNNGSSAASKLTKSILGIATAYLSLQGVGKVLGMADELSQTKARLDLMNDGLQSTEDLQKAIYQSAQRTGDAYGMVAASVAGFGMRAKEAFSSNAETIQFAENLNKQFSIAGATQMEVASATLQLTQALGSGILRGEEFNAVFEAAPNIIQTIADYMDVPIGKMKDMASDGEISASIVKNAMIAATEDINKQFDSMPFTSEKLWQKVKNEANVAFNGVLQSINNMLNGERVSAFVATMSGHLWTLATVASTVFNGITTAITFLYDNFSYLEPVLVSIATAILLVGTYMGIATVATYAMAAAQWVWNAALAASPITGVVIAIAALVGLVYAAINAFNQMAGTSVSAMGVIAGSFMTGLAFIGNLFITLYNITLDVFGIIWNAIASVAEFIGGVFVDPIGSAVRLFADMAVVVLDTLSIVAKAIDTVFGSNLNKTLSGWKGKINAKVEADYGAGVVDIPKFDSSAYQLERYDYGNAYDSGYNFGSNLSMGFGNEAAASWNGTDGIKLLGDIADGIDSIDAEGKKKKKKDAKTAKMLVDDLKYLRDLANAEAINRFTTASIQVDMTNQNTINSDLDLDGIVNDLVNKTEEAMEAVASGV